MPILHGPGSQVYSGDADGDAPVHRQREGPALGNLVEPSLFAVKVERGTVQRQFASVQRYGGASCRRILIQAGSAA